MRMSPQLCGGFPLVVLLLFSIFVTSQAVWLNLQARGTKCVLEELHNNVVVLGDYTVVSDDHFHPSPYISIKVTSPFGKVIHQENNVSHGQFAFTTTEAGNYLACIWADGQPGSKDLSVNLDWRNGVAAKDWETVARKEHLEGLELDLKKLEGVVDAIHESLMYLKIREIEMFSVSEATNSKVAWYNIMSLGVCIATSVVQILYLKQYFQKKKLI